MQIHWKRKAKGTGSGTMNPKSGLISCMVASSFHKKFGFHVTSNKQTSRQIFLGNPGESSWGTERSTAIICVALTMDEMVGHRLLMRSTRTWRCAVQWMTPWNPMKPGPIRYWGNWQGKQRVGFIGSGHYGETRSHNEVDANG